MDTHDDEENDNKKMVAYFGIAAIKGAMLGDKLNKYLELVDIEITFNKTVQNLMLSELDDYIKLASEMRERIKKLNGESSKAKH